MVIDGRKEDVSEYRQVPRIKELCAKHHTDGLMILTTPGGADFVMDFFNPDGTGGMMCGNGGRCITAFADYLGLKPASPDGTWHFIAPDGPHEAKIIDGSEGTLPCEPSLRDPSHLRWAPPSYAAEGGHRFSGESTLRTWTVRLKMIDVQGVMPMKNGYFLNTGTRHYVEFRDDVDGIDMEKEAKPLRWDPAFQPEGTNVNFVERTAEGLKVRTYEKGVEGETLACGTGITASAIAAYWHKIPDQVRNDNKALYRLQCHRGDWLSVEFKKEGPERFTHVYLTGPAELVEILP